MRGFELAFLVGAASLEGLEVLLDHPPTAIAVDDECDLVSVCDGEIRKQKPLDRWFSTRRPTFDDIHDVQRDRFRAALLGLGCSRDFDSCRRKAQTCKTSPSTRMSLTRCSGELRPTR